MQHNNKLAILAPYPFSPPQSGGHKAVMAYVKYLVASWPDTICISTTDNEPIEGIEIVSLFDDRKSKYFNPKVGWRIRQLLRERNICYLALQHHYFGLLLLPFLLGLSIKVVVFSHNLEYQRWRSIGKWWWPLMWLSEYVVYHWANAVAFISIHDQAEAPQRFGLSAKKCLSAPYPVDQSESPATNSVICRAIRKAHEFDDSDKLLLFFGPQNYAPNLAAVEGIIHHIHPRLQVLADFKYRILICGGGLPKKLDGFRHLTHQGIHYLGFVENIEDYVAACDVVLNPISTGGGVKTKLVEAVAYGKTVVSYQTGALGIDPKICGEKLRQVADNDYDAFAREICLSISTIDLPTPPCFYSVHYGENAIREVKEWMIA
ncbi:glycosyltransferase family 4 protein [Lewinella sp. LCG006]|uniref:glycosyltransferase family 4 protein n=1 Tax=Lewinella sp. LCG006 TaxID=3231911 RepID=UPI003461617C